MGKDTIKLIRVGEQMEIWDAYNSSFEKIDGMTLIRGEEESIPQGVYHLVCDILVRHMDGTILIMQRDPSKSYPGRWEATAGGSALRGEDPLECAKRELREETGIIASELQEIRRFVWDPTHSFYVEYLCETDCDKNSVILREGETVAFKWVTADEVLKMSADKMLSWRMRRYIMEKMVGQKNPWKEISLDDYEKHMSLDSVNQLQTMNRIMKEQFEAYPVETAMVLGVAGGNGLEHVDIGKYKTVYGIDINEDYLKAVTERYVDLAGVLQCLNLDIANEAAKLPKVKLLIANLLIEYIGYEAFQRAVQQVDPEYVSCVIQINTDEKKWVSDSPYIHAFDGLDAVHHQMEQEALTSALQAIRYTLILQESENLPNGKALLRLDYHKENII